MNIQEKIYHYFEQYPDLHVLFIFDPSGYNQIGLDGLDWRDGYEYQVFDGSWFTMKYRIHHEWRGKKATILFPGLQEPKNQETRLAFPLLGEMMANVVYQEQGYQEFMQQYDLDERMATYVEKHIDELNTGKVKTALLPYLTRDLFNKDVARRAILSVYLGSDTALTWEDIIIKLIILCGGENEKKVTDFFVRLRKNQDVAQELWEKLMSLFGVTYDDNTEEKLKKVAESIKYNAITQSLAPISADDYKGYKITNGVTLEKLNHLMESVSQVPKTEKLYTEALMKLGRDIREDQIIKWYGWDANYYYVSDALCWPILKNLLDDQFEAAPTDANDYLRSLRQKKAESSPVVPVIDFISNIAFFYEKLKTISSLKLNTPDDYIALYKDRFYLIDQFYRLSIEAYYQLKLSEIPIHAELAKVKSRLDENYSKICNILNFEWVTCLNERGEGFKSIKSLHRQQDFYKDNLADRDNKVTVIISDALRYEVAKELMDSMGKHKHAETLDMALAMLPTETKYCKLSLFPHETLAIDEDELLIDGAKSPVTMEQRTAFLRKYNDDAICVDFNEVFGSTKENRDIFKKDLVVVFHKVIDDSGHELDPGTATEVFRSSINKLREFIQRLHATYNVTDVILTSDHGFLLEDKVFEAKDKHPVKDDFIEKKTRYYLTRSDEKIDGITKFRLTEVSGMTDQTMKVAVPIGTNRLAAPGGYQFAHGGASLQELLIPVLYSTRQKIKGKEKVNVTLLEANLKMTSSRLRFTIIQSEAVSENINGRTVKCAVFAGDEQVTTWKEVSLESADAQNVNNRLFSVELTLNRQTEANILELRIFDSKEDNPNPLLKKTVINKTLIEQDF